MKTFLHFLVFAFLMMATTTSSAQETGFLVLSPDRGFLGNEEVRDAFAEFKRHAPESALAIATAEETESNLREALAKVDAQHIIVLPLFVSTHHALYRKAKDALASMERPVTIAPPFGAHYLAEEIWFDRVEDMLAERPLPAHHEMAGGQHSMHGGHQSSEGSGYLVMVAAGADSPASAEGIKEDARPLLEHAVEKYGFVGGDVIVNYTFASSGEASREASENNMANLKEAAEEYEHAYVLPFNLGMKFTNMMSQWHWMKRSLAAIPGVTAGEENILPHPNALRWLRWAANGYQPLTAEEVGIIMVPHGATYNWNERMRECIAPVRDDYDVEEAFSMVDSGVIERAVRKLEEQGKRAAVVVRIFSMASSFREKAEYVLGLSPEMAHAGHGGRFPDRINTHLRMTTLGGIEDNPHFANALLDRAREISTDPARETIILLGHGTGSDKANERWMDNLASMAEHMRATGGDAFKDIRYHTWREDWPEKRKQSVEVIRELVREASEGDGIALVIPARTTAQGPADEYLEGLDYRLGYGFCPHPEFVEWLRGEIRKGIEALNETPAGNSLM